MTKKFREYDRGDGRKVREYAKDWDGKDEMKDIAKEAGTSFLMGLLQMIGNIIIQKTTKK